MLAFNSIKPNLVLSRRSLHTGISILHDSATRLQDSVQALQLLGFELISADHLQDSDAVVHRLYNRGLHLDLVEDKRLSRLRQLRRAQPLTTVLKIETFPGFTNPPVSDLAGDYIPDLFGVVGAAIGSPNSLTVEHHGSYAHTSHTYTASSADKNVGTVGVKEVFIPYADGHNSSSHKEDIMPALVSAGLVPHKRFPGVYSCASSDSGGTTSTSDEASAGVPYASTLASTFRVFPSKSAQVGIVLQVDDVGRAEQYLRAAGLSLARLGNKQTDLELQVTGLDNQACYLFDALDIRLTQSAQTKPFYREGVGAVLEGTISSIQNTRVMAGDDADNTELDSRTLKGDCWAEVKGMVGEKVRGPTKVQHAAARRATKLSGSYSVHE